MNLDILRNEWAERDAKIDAALRINARLLRAGLAEQHREALRRHLPFGPFEQLMSALAAVLLVAFIGRHLGEPAFLVPAFAMLGWVVATGVAGLRQRAAMERLDLAQPTVAALRELEALKVRRLATLRWAFLTGQVVWWVPFVVVLFKGLLGVDLYAVGGFMPVFLAVNVALGILFIPGWIALARHFAGRIDGAPWFQRLTDAVAGEDLAKARAFVGELQRYEAA